MSSINLATSIHICEDTEGNFDVRDILSQAGYAASASLTVSAMYVVLPDGTTSTKDTPLFGKVDADTIYIRPGQWHADYNGEFTTIEFVVDQGAGNTVTMTLQVIVDPVNDAPTAADKTFNLDNGNAVVLSQGDFGFVDAVEHDAFQSVIVTSLPSAGKLLLNGVAIAENTEVSAADIAAGKLAFEPSQSTSGSFDIGFKVRDAGGLVGCGAADTSATPNYLTFKVPPAHLGDFVWEDSNGNGVQDAGEAGIGNVVVELKDASGKIVQTTSTDAAGRYNFTADPGSYTVSVKAPAGYVFTGKDAGADDAIDSDVGATGQTEAITLKAGDINNTVDAGLYKNASVGDRVWLDTNKNGLQDSGEAGVSNVKVSLFGADGKQVGASVTTDANGNYQFSNLKPGSYSVVFDKASLPEGMTFTSANQGGNDAADSDVNAAGQSNTFTLTSGQIDMSVDAGVLAAATIGDRVWIDNNGNGLQDSGEAGKSGVTVELRDNAGKVLKTTTTDNNGNYKFSVEAGTYLVAIKTPTGYTVTTQKVGSNNAIDSDANASGNLGSVTVTAGQNVTTMDAGIYQKSSIGDKVWLDSNGDGIQQSGEAGVKGVGVTLLNEKNVVVGTTTTDASGLYSFGDLGPGKYSVKFAAVDGYLFTKQNQGSNDSLDSDVDSSGKSAQITLASGVNDKTHDAGLVKASSIGDTIWEDSNYNGVQDKGEKGVDGVTVKLYDGNNVLKGTTVTHDGGQYLFGGLAAGNYKVEVVKANGWFFTKADVGDYATDSDVTSVAGNTGRTDSISLDSGEQMRSVDVGIYRKGSIGDKVWRDSNHNGIQDSGEEGIGGISVSLYDTANNKLGTVKTDTNGNYKFAELTPGNYYLVFDKSNVMFKNYNMNDWKWGVKNTGNNDGLDSDVNGDMISKVNVTKTDTINLSSGENDMSWDAGITPIAIDLNGDGIHTIARGDMQGSFDLLGTGKAIQSGWLSKGDGFLAIDSNGNGSIDNISELFGGTGKGSGFAKLASYDSNGDGVVNASDAHFGSLLIWQDANSNGKTDAGELISLTAAGVTGLNVGYTELPFLDANNNLHLERSSVTLSNGKTADMTDVYFNVAASDAAAAGVTLPTMADLMADASQQVQLVGQSQQCEPAFA